MAGSAGDVRAGGAWYELWGKDKLTPLLEKAKKGAESFGGAMKSLGKRAGVGADAAFGGVKDGLKGLAMSLGHEAFKGVVSLISGLEDLKKEYEKTARMLAQLDAMTERNMAKRTEMIEAEIDPKKKVLAIDKEIAKLQQDDAISRSLNTQLQEQKDRTGMFKRKGTTYERLQGFSMWWQGEQESTLQNVQAQIDAQHAAQDKIFARLQELSDQRGKLLNPDRDPEKIKATAELTRELKKQADTFQQAADKVKLYELEMQNYSKAQIAAVDAAQQRVKLHEVLGGAAAELAGSVASTGKDFTKEVKDTTDGLKEQLGTWGMLSEQATVHKLKLKGVRDEALKTAQATADQITRLNALAGAAGELFGGVSGKAKELAEELKGVTEELREQADTWNMTAEQAAIYKLRAKGIRGDALGPAQLEADRIKLKNILGGAADAIANGVASVEKITLASPGSFTAGNAAQRFGAETIPEKQLKAAEVTAKNTGNIVKAISDLGRGLTFK
ncbi:unnamed protein product [Gemmata massiliana]|uniref:Uncharacterized protein n=1 Tax=Gemmata massiliana TaxID=1210884 RepID=A0A6P2D567_9BACT|nr:hypothetical protein [Gemmata massiliana]VTR96047.1 unnamed protein product [Gemmata massiliana]